MFLGESAGEEEFLVGIFISSFSQRDDFFTGRKMIEILSFFDSAFLQEVFEGGFEHGRPGFVVNEAGVEFFFG